MNTTFKKRSFSLLLSFLLILCSLPFAVFTASAAKMPTYNPFTESTSGTAQDDPTTNNPFDKGNLDDGLIGRSADKPFILDCVDDLDILSAIVNGIDTTSSTSGDPITGYTGKVFDCAGYYFKLADNIGAKEGENNQFINTIGWYDGLYYFFNGSFNGAGHSIWVNINDGYNVGLFGCINSSASVANVNVYGTVSGSCAGGVCGENRGSIANCFSYCSTVEGDSYAGGVCGYNSGSIANCFSDCTTVEGCDAGGVCGYNEEGGSIANCFSDCSNVTAIDGDAGGVCGFNYGPIANCFSSCSKVSSNWNAGSVCGENSGSIAYCYFDSDVCKNGSGESLTEPIGDNQNQSETINVLGLPHDQCVAASGTTDGCTASIGKLGIIPLVDALNAYVDAYNKKLLPLTVAGTLFGAELEKTDVIDPSKLKNIKLCYWDKQTGDYHPHLSKATKEKPLTSVNVNMFIAKPAIGCRLLRAKAFSPTKNVRVTHVRTTWFDGTHRIATKAHLGGKYTAMVSFKLDTAEEYDIADGAKVWVRLNGKRVRATKRGDTYTVMCSFKKLSICNVLSNIYKNLFWRIF